MYMNSTVKIINQVKNIKALRWLSGKESTYNAGDTSLTPGSGRSPGEVNSNPFQYSGPGKSHGQRSLAGYSPWVRKRVGHDLATKQQKY